VFPTLGAVVVGAGVEAVVGLGGATVGAKVGDTVGHTDPVSEAPHVHTPLSQVDVYDGVVVDAAQSKLIGIKAGCGSGYWRFPAADVVCHNIYRYILLVKPGGLENEHDRVGEPVLVDALASHRTWEQSCVIGH